jgi:hypothetical protein
MVTQLLTVQEAAEALRIKPATVRAWLLRRQISSFRFPHGVDALLRDATAPVITTEAENSALASKALADRNPGQVQILEVA